jgi:tetratricopeptide (TPR) repeat protein
MRQYNPEAIEQATALYQQALAIDPTYAPAWDGLADAYYRRMDLGVTTTDQGLALAREAINQALANDPTYAPVYARLAMIDGITEGDLAGAARHLEQGLVLDPANLDVISSAVWIARRLGRLDQTIALGVTPKRPWQKCSRNLSRATASPGCRWRIMRSAGRPSRMPHSTN